MTANGEKHLVLAGGGHAHLVALANLKRLLASGCRVTVISPSDHHYYSGMGPGLLGGLYEPEDIRFDIRRATGTAGAAFVSGRVERIDPRSGTIHLTSGETLTCDILSVNIGSEVPDELVSPDQNNIIPDDILSGDIFPDDIFPVKPIENLIAARNRILELTARGRIEVIVVGGGPAAVEIAGNLRHLVHSVGRQPPRIRLFADWSLLGRSPEIMRRKALRILSRRGIEILENSPVSRVTAGAVTLASGRTVAADVIFLASGVRPSPVFARSGLPVAADGGLLVNQYLQCVDYPGIFGGGDCVCFSPRPLDKAGVYAVRQGPVLYHNLLAAVTGSPPRVFDPGGGYLMILNAGGRTGILKKGRLVWSGRTAFLLKDYIDRRFMNRFDF